MQLKRNIQLFWLIPLGITMYILKKMREEPQKATIPP